MEPAVNQTNPVPISYPSTPSNTIATASPTNKTPWFLRVYLVLITVAFITALMFIMKPNLLPKRFRAQNSLSDLSLPISLNDSNYTHLTIGYTISGQVSKIVTQPNQTLTLTLTTVGENSHDYKFNLAAGTTVSKPNSLTTTVRDLKQGDPVRITMENDLLTGNLVGVQINLLQ